MNQEKDETKILHESTITSEEVKYSRYLQVTNRVVKHTVYQNELPHTIKEIEYDIVGARTQSCLFVAVVPYNSSTGEFTVLKEYAQGANSFLYGVPCGGFTDKHTNLEHCASMELSEEAFLRGGQMIRLIPESHPGLLEVKWCKNRFVPYLVIDPQADEDPHPRDDEEFISLLKVDLPTLKGLMYGGEMMLPSLVACSMAIEYLQERKQL